MHKFMIFGNARSETGTLFELLNDLGVKIEIDLKEVVYSRLSKVPKQTTQDVYALTPNGAELERDFELEKGTLAGS